MTTATGTDFSTTITVDKSAKQVFQAITNVRGWWSEEVEGGTSKLNDQFRYHYKDVHICTIKLTEVIEDKKIVWHVLDNYFNFIEDKQEWINTRIIFEISEKDGKTQLKFTHEGLVPDYECYEVCRDAWSNYIKGSLYDLIMTGKGKPNPKEGSATSNGSSDFQTSMSVPGTPGEVFHKINEITKWWTEDFSGSAKNLNDEFTVRFDNVHITTQKVIELEPGKKIVWLVTESQLNFIKDTQEWKGTTISFNLVKLGDRFTRIEFKHHGLRPEKECFKDCQKGWNQFLQGSLVKYIEEGKGVPHKKH